MCNNILTLIQCICGLVQAVYIWFKGYIKTITLKEGFNKYKTGNCLLYIVSKLGTDIYII